jgi:hypothetical protein
LKTDFQKLTAWKQKGSVRITALDPGQKALRGESHEHFRHETGSEVAKGDERHDGNQTMQVFVMVAAVTVLMKPFAAKML